MNAVSGIYLRKIFIETLGASEDCILREESKQDFGNQHPDPNCKYSVEFLKLMGINSEPSAYTFGAAFDGDADRHMILGNNCFVTPSDDFAVIVNNHLLIDSLKDVKGVARTYVTSKAVDKVAEKLNLNLEVTPVGWKYFSELMEEGKV